MHPVYVILYEELYGGGELASYGLPRAILAVISCDASDLDNMYQRQVIPLQSAGRHVQMIYFSREPDSFLRETVAHDE